MSENRAIALARPAAGLPAPEEWRTMVEMGETFVKSGLLPNHIKSGAAAVAIMQKGRELGIPPMYAFSHIYMVNGRLTVAAEIMAALVERDHGPTAMLIDESTNERCTISYQKRGMSERRSYTYTIEDAERAKLATRDTWKHHPAAMLRARCISAVARMAFPASIAGMYTPEEMGAEVELNDDGEVISVRASDPEPQRPTARVEDIAEAEYRDVERGDGPDQLITKERASALWAKAKEIGWGMAEIRRAIPEVRIDRLGDLTNQQHGWVLAAIEREQDLLLEAAATTSNTTPDEHEAFDGFDAEEGADA